MPKESFTQERGQRTESAAAERGLERGIAQDIQAAEGEMAIAVGEVEGAERVGASEEEVAALRQDLAEVQGELRDLEGAESAEASLETAIESMNAFVTKYHDHLAAGDAINDYADPDEIAGIRAGMDQVRIVIEGTSSDESTKIGLLNRLSLPLPIKQHLVRGAAEVIAKRDPVGAETLLGAFHESVGIPFEDREELKQNFAGMHKGARLELAKTQLEQLIAHGEPKGVLQAAQLFCDHSEHLREDRYQWMRLADLVDTALGTMIENGLQGGFNACLGLYAQIPEAMPAANGHTLKARLILYEYAAKTLTPTERRAFLKADVDRASAFNKERMMQELRKTHGEEAIQVALQSVQQYRMTTLNINFGSLGKMVESKRLKSSWEADSRTDAMRRDVYERAIGIRSTGTPEDPHPIYVALAHGELDGKRGAARSFGDCYLRVREDVVRDRAIFLYGDLGDLHIHQEHRRRQFNYDDAALARAKMILDGATSSAPYIEGELMGGLALADLESVQIPKEFEDTAKEDIDDMRARLTPHMNTILV